MSLIPFAGAVQKFNRQRGGYQIERSLRVNSADSAYLNRTPASAGNRRTWTWSGWVKRSSAKYSLLFAAGNTNDIWNSSSTTQIAWAANENSVSIYNNGTYFRTTTQVFRDFSAWGHLVVAIDTTQATAANRVKMYWNGEQITAFSTSNDPTLNLDTFVNATHNHVIGGQQTSVANSYFNGYLTEINFIDGSALDPTSFGEFNATTGVWQPKAYTGSYGTNGFYLNFSDNSGVTSTTLGADSSGNGNNWTPNNFSVTAGAGNDSLVDTPTPYGDDTGVGGEVRGNYCTWNPLAKSDNHTVSNGNLDISASGGTSYGAICATIGASSGKWYWEMIYNRSSASNSPVVGFGNDLFNYRNPPFGYLGSDLNAGGINVISGSAQINGGSTAYGSAIATNDIVMFAMDLDNRKFYIGKNGTWFNSGDPVAGTNSWPYSGNIVGSTFFPAANIFDNSAQTNFGQRPFAYTAPSGFKALCTQNLPEPTIVDGGDYFNTLLYNGSASSQNITGVGFSPDLVWIKTRSNAESHQLVDQVRGATKALMSNETSAETTWADGLSAFLSDGFTLPGGNNRYSDTGYTYVAWNWKAGNSNVTNTDGTITSTVRANPTAGFSIVTYTGNSSNATVGHGLGVAPSMIIIKNRSSGTAWWPVQHKSLGNGYGTVLFLNSTDAASAIGYWTAANTPTVFTLRTDNDATVNKTGDNYVAYCFAPVAGYSAFGSYTGNGSADGPFQYLGFRPAFVMIKTTSNAGYNWNIHDTARNPYNSANLVLYPNTSAGDDAYSAGSGLDILSNGFKARDAGGGLNGSNFTYIYAAFAENPFKNSLAR